MMTDRITTKFFRRRRAFTFLEIILVVTIIGILMSIVGPRLVGRTKQAKIGAARQQMDAIKTALLAFEIDTSELPSGSDGLRALIQRPSSVHEDDWNGPYLENRRVPTDAWGEPFIYTFPSQHMGDFDLASKGPDRTEGTDDDITNWEGLDIDN